MNPACHRVGILGQEGVGIGPLDSALGGGEPCRPTAYQNLIPNLTEEANRLEGLMPEAEEVDRKALDAGRRILLSAHDAAFSIVSGWAEKRG